MHWKPLGNEVKTLFKMHFGLLKKKLKGQRGKEDCSIDEYKQQQQCGSCTR